MSEEQIRAEFERERRYIVFKISDVVQLDEHQHRVLNNLCEAVQDVRQLSGKPELECVVVEKDWPEYELVWRMLEARMAGQAAPQPTDDRVRELEKDAERYRWLRNKANYAKKSDPMVCLHPLDNQILIDGSELDEAIDQAMKRASK